MQSACEAKCTSKQVALHNTYCTINTTFSHQQSFRAFSIVCWYLSKVVTLSLCVLAHSCNCEFVCSTLEIVFKIRFFIRHKRRWTKQMRRLRLKCIRVRIERTLLSELQKQFQKIVDMITCTDFDMHDYIIISASNYMIR